MDKKSKTTIIVAACVGVIVIVVAVALALILTIGNGYTGKLEVGQRYLSEGNYSDAILAFREALEIDDTDEDAYVGLVRAYYGSGMYTEAQEVLLTGINKTGSQKLRTLQEELFGADTNYNTETETETTTEETTSEAAKETEGGGDGAVVSVSLQGRITDQVTGESISNATVKIFKGSTAGGALVAQVTTDYSGNYYADVDSGTNYYIQVEKEDYITSGESVYVFSTYDRTTENIQIVEEGVNQILGSVIDAATGEAISGASVSVYGGSDTGTNIGSATSDSNGEFNVTVSGYAQYTVVVSAEGYIENKTTVNADTENVDIDMNVSMSTVLGDDEIRIVLTWGETPRDLDSYLDGTSSTGSSVNVRFSNKVATDSSGKVAELDLDDTTSYGPETTTVYDIYGSYEFRVADFNRTGKMGEMGAQVKVYKGSSLLYTIDAPSDVEDSWSVLEIENGEVRVTNYAKETNWTTVDK